MKKGMVDINKNAAITRKFSNRCEIKFYASGINHDLTLSFGTAQVFYSIKDGQIIFNGFYDSFNFDPRDWGNDQLGLK